jgi:plasmid stability protein
MTDLLLHDIPPHLLTSLETLAVRHGRSLQQEVLFILEAALNQRSPLPAKLAAEIRVRLEQSGRTFSSSTELIREDRAR